MKQDRVISWVALIALALLVISVTGCQIHPAAVGIRGHVSPYPYGGVSPRGLPACPSGPCLQWIPRIDYGGCVVPPSEPTVKPLAPET